MKRFIDLNGDGHADILITQDELFVWYPSQAREGFGAAETVRKAQDEEGGPALVFADGTQSIYLADMSGDGLNDLVRIRNGEVCYWPSLGYGRFGARVTMDEAPWFDHPELFDQKRVRLADIDGSGTTDIIYLGREEISIWLNQAGNHWSEPQRLMTFPTVDDLAEVQAIDLLGNGTACLVWSSPLPGQRQQPMQYIDLMGGQKPHLMTSMVNNLGAETKLQYAASTKFYLEDRKKGNPWITRLPFPVHVVERVETIDHLTGNRFVSLYRYRHAYFDGEEREFRGFGFVEQWDTEAYVELAKGNLFAAGTNEEESSHVPPVHTKTWFHTGAFIDREHLSTYFAETEYYREPRHRVPEDADPERRREIEAEFKAMLLPDTVLPDGLTTAVTERREDGTEETRTINLSYELTAQEEREACRALKGSVLRQEVYALDGTGEAEHPFTVTESNYEIRQLQPQDGERYGVFFVHPRESLAYHLQRHPEEPRVTHQMTLEVDGFGNVRRAVAIAYGRRKIIHVVNERGEVEAIPNPKLNQLNAEDRKRQTDIPITYTENRVTNKPNDLPGDPNWYRIGMPVETCTYEITGIDEADSSPWVPYSLKLIREKLQDIENLLQDPETDPRPEISYEAFADEGALQRRLIEQVRTYYRADDRADSLDPDRWPLGDVDSLALPCESFKRAFTETLPSQIYGKELTEFELTESELIALLDEEGGYVQLDSPWWIPSGRQAFDPALFYLPTETKDPFGQIYNITYDEYPLLVNETVDPLGNRVTIGERDSEGTVLQWGNNYRVMQPYLITDPNGNTLFEL